ncbi:isoleucyl-tRNA synthetase [Candidatus Blochmanniella floridana]|uniref:Isoleucine--tRNA ligase n=1 Tax=Blochmanniella floridana TaxID=203907 RepID=SYI_BLOFL|nr:RecName: Full=Isoleucine--tRNA ligase; AltName: Full=Isoleucyl-tRNA synthetase; Short=IleRS [Candidatus Blochmannia floridanus]CAD83639.1 isoleucyl-tRNA synthetase [Candidatus Blochmannia floridanus]
MADYKSTLNLPYTQFPMRGNLPIIEIKILERWNRDNLYEIIRRKKNEKKLFLLHDGPPYANGFIHLGHAVNKILKDIIIKFKGLSGYDAPYIPGWDCHGLPIELQVEKLIKKVNMDIDINSQEFRNYCREYVKKQIEIQKKDFIRLGILGEWKNPYLTMDYKTEANIIRTLGKIISNGYFYKGIKPVYWCFQCHSALANSEVEYNDYHYSNAVDVGFSIVENVSINKIFNINCYIENIELVIWTTTIWTLPANQAISIHPDYIYQLVKILDNEKYLIIAANLVNMFMNRIKCTMWQVLGEVLGSKLDRLTARHPFMNFNVPLVLSKHIKLDSGTGLVHIAPDHGPDDYLISKKYKFKNRDSLIDSNGYYLSNSHNRLCGLHIFNANEIIIDLLYKSKNFLYFNANYQHSYPYCWRHKIPLIFRTTSQWFVNMDHNNLRDKLLRTLQQVRWIPDSGYSSMQSMIVNRPDWCLSRQRVWGIPIPVFVHKKTEVLHPNTCIFIEQVAQLVEKYGIQIWWDLKNEDIILNKAESMNYQKIYDTLDVWFDSGSTHDSVILDRFNSKLKSKLQIDLYLEGVDQYRGWFMSSLIIAVAIKGYAPYKQVLSHGFTIDDKGNKMSKSLGNIIRPLDIVNKFGSDILRLWVASSDYSKDMVISDDVLKNVTDIYRRIRNTIRFFLANINDFDPEKDLVQSNRMVALDQWAINHTLSVQVKIISNYEQYKFHNVIRYIMKFCSIEMGSFYLDVVKDRLYTLNKDSLARRSCQTALYHIIESMVRWIAPILSFTADEIWKYIPGNRSKYVFTEEWYDRLFKIDENQIVNSNYWNFFLNIRNKVNKVIEQERVNGIIKGSLEADVILYVTPILKKKLRILKNELAFGLIVSSVMVLSIDDVDFNTIKENHEENSDELKVVLKKSHGIKCLRCWNYTLSMSKNENYLNICSRCVHNITGLGEDRRFF